MSGDIYREQAQRIDELEKENKRLAAEVEQGETRWKKGEEELEELREGRGEAALATEKAKEADKLVGTLDTNWTEGDADEENRSRKWNHSSDSFHICNHSHRNPPNAHRLPASLPRLTI